MGERQGHAGHLARARRACRRNVTQFASDTHRMITAVYNWHAHHDQTAETLPRPPSRSLSFAGIAQGHVITETDALKRRARRHLTGDDDIANIAANAARQVENTRRHRQQVHRHGAHAGAGQDGQHDRHPRPGEEQTGQYARTVDLQTKVGGVPVRDG